MLVKEVEIEFNKAFWDRLGFDKGVESVLDSVADTAVAQARSTAPVDTGAYRDSIHKVTARSPKRVIKRVVADDWKSALVEAKTSNLRKAVAKAKNAAK